MPGEIPRFIPKNNFPETTTDTYGDFLGPDWTKSSLVKHFTKQKNPPMLPVDRANPKTSQEYGQFYNGKPRQQSYAEPARASVPPPPVVNLSPLATPPGRSSLPQITNMPRYISSPPRPMGTGKLDTMELKLPNIPSDRVRGISGFDIKLNFSDATSMTFHATPKDQY
ncbi:uncharacterized protein LOC106165563 [Lingula anatina]|uniref:Uncharacterized protein LOC106165563 n=1 Tax=Lingula anatina TaxID=7574 RepID=A0A1S3IM40_LINAN|nr:uncharacterized protein LOC106165563 [Lingula anatina]XP_013399268.1 uncharacterized protein LOC106165563 [Lingula anatina]|eukprot:XP_013399267.1 uncharacterized protein LOC106165563 [Lingula anatina]